MYNGLKVLDVHGHVNSPEVARAFGLTMLASNYPSASPLSASPREGRGGGRRGRGRDYSDEVFESAAQEHADYLSERNIDVQIIGPRPYTMLGWMEPHLLPAWCSFTNDTIAKQAGFYPERFFGAAMLPQVSEEPDLSSCIPEIERCVGEYGFVAVYASPDPSGRRLTPGMHERYWDPLYERCQRLHLPIIVHGTNMLDPRFRAFSANYQLGFVIEQFLATHFLSNSDVFDRYPELKVLICHCGGALNRFIRTGRERDTSKNLFFDSCSYEINLLEAAIKKRGVDQVCFGSEAPGSGGAIRPDTGRTSDDMVPVIDSFSFLSAEDKAKIFNHNAARVFPGLAKIAAS